MTQSSAKKPRLPQRQRVAAAELPPFHLTKRDSAIVEVVYQYRALTTQQVSDLCFAPVSPNVTTAPNSRCLHRLKLLYQYGFLSRFEQPQILTEGRKPFVYQLDQRGAEWLARRAGCGMEDLDWRPGEMLSPLFLDHLLTTNAVRVAITRAARRHKYSLESWVDDKSLKATQNKDNITLTSATGRKQVAAVVPDGFFILHTGTHYYHSFIEIDRATTTAISGEWSQRTWARKVAVYLEYYQSGKYHERYKTRNLRILTVTTGPKRLAHLKEVTEDIGGKARFWFVTLADVLTKDVLLDPIWQVAGREGTSSLIW